MEIHETGTILMPIAGKSSRFPGTRPKWMLTAPTGELMLELSLRSVPNWRAQRVVIGALTEHLENGGREAIRRALGNTPEIVEFGNITKGPAETVHSMIVSASVRGPIFIKDCDSWFRPAANPFSNSVCFVDLRSNTAIRNVPSKSFLNLNENLIVQSIVEKFVCSPFISCGGYGFDHAQEYVDGYQSVVSERVAGEPFVSHVILKMIAKNSVFKGILSNEYVDVGTLEAWNEFRDRQTLYIIDIDGVIFKNAGQYISPVWDDVDIPLDGNIRALLRRQDAGAQFVFVTARPELYRSKTEKLLSKLGLRWHSIVMGVNHARRVLINDYAASNPYPSAVAINIQRNAEELGTFI